MKKGLKKIFPIMLIIIGAIHMMENFNTLSFLAGAYTLAYGVVRVIATSEKFIFKNKFLKTVSAAVIAATEAVKAQEESAKEEGK